MMRFWPLWVGYRYTRSKRRDHFISFISMISMLGIILGVLVLITVLSVMNGFDREVKERILSMVPHVRVLGHNGWMDHDREFARNIEKHEHVVRVIPFVAGQGMLSHGRSVHAVAVQAMEPDDLASMTRLSESILPEHLKELREEPYRMIVGEALAQSLGVDVGDQVLLIIPDVLVTPVGAVPRSKAFTVAGTFEVGYQYDSQVVLLHIDDAKKLYRMGDKITGFQVELDDLYLAPKVARRLRSNLAGLSARVIDWTRENQNFFEAVRLEKTLMFLMLLMIVAVAAFNILSSLVMMVKDKSADIAILKTLGAGHRDIMMIFMVQGCLIGVMGTIIGAVFGVVVAHNLPDWVQYIEQWWGVEFMSSDVYYVDFLPSHLLYSDVLIVVACSMTLSWLATLYPAWRAAQVHPQEALRYE